MTLPPSFEGGEPVSSVGNGEEESEFLVVVDSTARVNTASGSDPVPAEESEGGEPSEAKEEEDLEFSVVVDSTRENTASRSDSVSAVAAEGSEGEESSSSVDSARAKTAPRRVSTPASMSLPPSPERRTLSGIGGKRRPSGRR